MSDIQAARGLVPESAFLHELIGGEEAVRVRGAAREVEQGVEGVVALEAGMGLVGTSNLMEGQAWIRVHEPDKKEDEVAGEDDVAVRFGVGLGPSFTGGPP